MTDKQDTRTIFQKAHDKVRYWLRVAHETYKEIIDRPVMIFCLLDSKAFTFHDMIKGGVVTMAIWQDGLAGAIYGAFLATAYAVIEESLHNMAHRADHKRQMARVLSGDLKPTGDPLRDMVQRMRAYSAAQREFSQTIEAVLPDYEGPALDVNNLPDTLTDDQKTRIKEAVAKFDKIAGLNIETIGRHAPQNESVNVAFPDGAVSPGPANDTSPWKKAVEETGGPIPDGQKVFFDTDVYVLGEGGLRKLADEDYMLNKTGVQQTDFGPDTIRPVKKD